MRAGVCHMIHSISQAALPLGLDELKQIFGTLKENMRHPSVEIQEEATTAFQSYCFSYFKTEEEKEFLKFEMRTLFKMSKTDESQSITRGLNMCFGVVSLHLLDDELFKTELIETLLVNSKAKGKESDDAETRK